VSHFTVLVVGEDVEAQLKPFDENGAKVKAKNAKWDWWTIGGRWSKQLVTVEGLECDTSLVGELDRDAMKAKQRKHAAEAWAAAEKEKTSADVRELIYGIERGMTREQYLDASEAFTTFAVLKDGKWYERGKMGWWACVSNEKAADEWQAEFNKLLESLPPETRITVVDCHI
jgi:hypothetical protein